MDDELLTLSVYGTLEVTALKDFIFAEVNSHRRSEDKLGSTDDVTEALIVAYCMVNLNKKIRAIARKNVADSDAAAYLADEQTNLPEATSDPYYVPES